MNLLQELSKVVDFTTLRDYLIDPKTGLLRYEVIPPARKEDVDYLQQVVREAGAGKTEPVKDPIKVEPVKTEPLPTELLPHGIKTGFDLKAGESKQYSLDLVKDKQFALTIDVKTLTSPDAGVQFVNPHNKAGHGYKKLNKGLQTLTLTAEKTGVYLISFDANAGALSVSSASLTTV